MGKETLVAEKITAAQTLLEGIEEQGIDFSVALWLYRSATEDWKLYIGVNDFGQVGPQPYYEGIQKVFSGLPDTLKNQIELSDIFIVNSNYSELVPIKMMFHTGPKDIGGIRASGNYVNGMLIEDAYIYRAS